MASLQPSHLLLTDLPTEILLRILSHFDVYELLSCVALVSRLFRDIALSPILWLRIDLHEVIYATCLFNLLRGYRLFSSCCNTVHLCRSDKSITSKSSVLHF